MAKDSIDHRVIPCQTNEEKLHSKNITLSFTYILKGQMRLLYFSAAFGDFAVLEICIFFFF